MILFILGIILLLGCIYFITFSCEGFTSNFKYGDVKTEFVTIKNTMPTVINVDDRIVVPNSFTYSSLGGPMKDTREPDRTTTNISEYHMLKKRLI